MSILYLKVNAQKLRTSKESQMSVDIFKNFYMGLILFFILFNSCRVIYEFYILLHTKKVCMYV